jgi:hypothetical protein
MTIYTKNKTANTKMIISLPFPAAPLMVKFRILGLYSFCKSCKKNKYAFVDIGSTLQGEGS